MSDDPYKNREIDAKFEEVHHRFDDQDEILNDIKIQTTTTNGKVKKIIIALVLLGGFALGIFGKEILPILIKLI